MARKPVLEGGKRDEIIAAASRLFFTEGYENTSVRKILNSVGGEVGMFYHYFESKEELFDIVADRFFRQYEESFRKMASGIRTPEEFAERFLELYDTAMKQYGRIEHSMHWTIRSAFHERTVQALVPTAAELLKQFPAFRLAEVRVELEQRTFPCHFLHVEADSKRLRIPQKLQRKLEPQPRTHGDPARFQIPVRIGHAHPATDKRQFLLPSPRSLQRQDLFKAFHRLCRHSPYLGGDRIGFWHDSRSTDVGRIRPLGFATERDGVWEMTAKGAFYYHYYENFYTLAYIDKMWGIMRQEAFPSEIRL